VPVEVLVEAPELELLPPLCEVPIPTISVPGGEAASAIADVPAIKMAVAAATVRLLRIVLLLPRFIGAPPWRILQLRHKAPHSWVTKRKIPQSSWARNGKPPPSLSCPLEVLFNFDPQPNGRLMCSANAAITL